MCPGFESLHRYLFGVRILCCRLPNCEHPKLLQSQCRELSVGEVERPDSLRFSYLRWEGIGSCGRVLACLFCVLLCFVRCPWTRCQGRPSVSRATPTASLLCGSRPGWSAETSSCSPNDWCAVLNTFAESHSRYAFHPVDIPMRSAIAQISCAISLALWRWFLVSTFKDYMKLEIEEL